MFKRQGLFEATATLGLARVVFQILLFAQFTYFLYAFGSSQITDALIIAQTLPFLLSNLFNRGFTHTFIPLFADFRERRSEDEAWEFATSVMIITMLALTALMVMTLTFAPVLISVLAPGFSPEERDLAASLLRYLSLFIVLNGISGLPRCLYFSYRSFRVPAVSSLFLSLSVIAAIFLFRDSIGIYAVVLGIIAGSSIQVAVLFSCLNKGERKIKFNLRLRQDGIKQFSSLIGPRFISMAIARLNVIVDRVFASGLGTAFVSALSYADRLCTAPLEFINATFGVVIIPILASDAAQGDIDRFKDKVRQYIRNLSFAVIPVMILFIVLGESVIQILFQRGAFGTRGVRLTSAALVFYCLGLLPVAISSVLRGSFFALKDTITPLKVGVLTFFLNIGFNYVLVRLLSIRGLALATALVQWTSMVLLLHLIQEKVGSLELKEARIMIGKVALAGVSMGIVVWLLNSRQMLTSFSNQLITRPLQVAVAGALGGLTYFVICRSLQIEEAAMVITRIKGINSRIRNRRNAGGI